MPTQKQEKRWYILRLPSANNKARDELAAESERRSRIKMPPLEYFAPVFTDVDSVGGKSRPVTKPLYLNYVFMRSTVDAINKFRTSYPHYNLIRRSRTAASDDCLYVGDSEMRMMQVMARVLDNTMLCLSPDMAALNKGDRVRIIGGDFAGVEGILLTRQGRDGGRVVINVCNQFAVSTLTIRPEFIKVISFDKDGRHLYKKLDSYYPRIRRAMRRHVAMQAVSAAEREAVETFVARFGTVEIPSEKIKGKYLAFMLMSHTVLGSHPDLRNYYAWQCSQLIPSITNDTTRAFILTAMYACTRDAKYRHVAEDIVSRWDKSRLTPKQQDVVDDLAVLP